MNRFPASISGASAGVRLQAEWQRGEVGLIRRGAVKARVWTPAIIKVQVAADRSAGLGYAFVGPQYASSYLTLRHRRSTNTLSRKPLYRPC